MWQWIRHGAAMEDGRKITVEMANAILKEEMAKIRSEVGEARFAAGQYERASKIFSELMTSGKFVEFLTLPAYEYLG